MEFLCQQGKKAVIESLLRQRSVGTTLGEKIDDGRREDNIASETIGWNRPCFYLKY